jgi:hypothetical protein
MYHDKLVYEYKRDERERMPVVRPEQPTLKITAFNVYKDQCPIFLQGSASMSIKRCVMTAKVYQNLPQNISRSDSIACMMGNLPQNFTPEIAQEYKKNPSQLHLNKKPVN